MAKRNETVLVLPARGLGPFPTGGEHSSAPLLPGARLLPAPGPQTPACSWGNGSLARFRSFLVAASSQIGCELHQRVTYFKLSPNASCEHMSASGPAAICLLWLSGRARAALSSACPQEANGDLLVRGLGLEVSSPPASSRLSGSFGGDAQEPFWSIREATSLLRLEVTRGTRRRLVSECSCGSHGLGTAHGVAIETPGDNDNTSSKSPQMCKRKGWEEVNEVLVFGGCDGKRKKKRERKRKASPPLQQAREECHSLERKLQGSQ